MITKPVDRLLFAQGGLCFFCNAPLPKDAATVEHLVASSRGGSNADDNCVACCQTLNSLLGNLTLKEKLRVVLNQQGQFKCPNSNGPVALRKAASSSTALDSSLPLSDNAASRTNVDVVSPEAIASVIANLKSRGNAKPRRIKTLSSTIKSLASLKLTDKQVASIVQHLAASGKITINKEQVAYKL